MRVCSVLGSAALAALAGLAGAAVAASGVMAFGFAGVRAMEVSVSDAANLTPLSRLGKRRF